MRHILPFVEDELAGALGPALADDEHAGPCDGLLAIEADQVDVDRRGEHDLLAVIESVQHLQTSLDATGALEVESRGGVGHIGP